MYICVCRQVYETDIYLTLSFKEIVKKHNCNQCMLCHPYIKELLAGCSSVGLERAVWGGEVVGSNPTIPTNNSLTGDNN